MCFQIAQRYGMRLIGPNCVGTMDLYTGLNTTFIQGVPERGRIGFVSQSGAVAGGVVDYIRDKGVGFSNFASLGNEADTSETDMIEYLEQDPNTAVITIYVESIRNGRRFIEVASRVTRHKTGGDPEGWTHFCWRARRVFAYRFSGRFSRRLFGCF
jgi:acetate---CoA ligase (ADP-forming)